MLEEAGGGGAVTRSDNVEAEDGVAGGKGGNGSAYTNTGGLTWYASGGVGILDGSLQSSSTAGTNITPINPTAENIEKMRNGRTFDNICK